AKSFEKFKFNLGTSLLSAENEFEKPSNLGTNLDNFSRQGNAHFGWNVRLSDNTSLSGKNSFNYNNLKTYNSGSSLNNGIETDISTLNNVKFSYQSLSVKSDTDFLFNFANVEYINSRLTSNIDNTGFFKTGISENIKWLCDFTAAINFEWLSYNPSSNRITANLGAGKKFQIGKFSIEPQLATLIWFNQNFGIRLLPRLTMSFEGLSLSFFRECTLPTFNQLYWPKTSYASGNPTLNSEDGWSAFLGFKRDDFPLWAQYKFSYYGNKICWTSQNGKLIPANSADGIYNVVTLGIEQNFFDSILKVSLDATYTSARLCSTFKQIMWVPEWQAHAGICINVWRIIFNADYSFTGRRWASNENVFFYPEFHLLDITLTARCTDSVQAYLKVNNLLDQKIAWHDSYYIPSRKFTIGIKIEK
ncbi:TonB-dependent receptor, partial [Treponema sp.]|uniref:TonB-dependent receptor n=1 Tax=Treponema sp. TaxID=166 RepID=UPI0025800C14